MPLPVENITFLYFFQSVLEECDVAHALDFNMWVTLDKQMDDLSIHLPFQGNIS